MPRPESFVDFIGQKHAVDQLEIAIESAKRRNAVLDHILLSGPAGVGKTTIARIISHKTGAKIYEVISTVIKKPGDILQTLVKLRRGDIVFVDEVHGLVGPVQEFLYSAMEDYQISTISGNQMRRAITVPLNPFVLIGATTVEGQLSSPLLQRFGIHCTLEPYTIDDMMKIVKGTCKLPILETSVRIIAERCRSTPRIAIQHVKRVIDSAVVMGKKMIDDESVLNAYRTMGIMRYGLTRSDVAVLKALVANQRCVGVEQLAAMTNISRQTIEYVVEPHLLRCQFIRRMPRGREVTPVGISALSSLSKE